MRIVLKRWLAVVLALPVLIVPLHAQISVSSLYLARQLQVFNPKREFRAAWVACVVNLDWPSAPGLSSSTQQSQIITLLDGLKAAGMNAVIFQVRVECDAFYNSSIEPWSYWLTGNQGSPPNPFYDPLEFIVTETHKRGMELHAWFNPYRAVRQVSGSYAQAPSHVTNLHPDWVMTFGSTKILDPGIPAVRAYVTSVIMDVVRRYDIDGVHWDDYFYPYPVSGVSIADSATYANNNPDGLAIADWRRKNVHLLVNMVSDSIRAVKPFVKFGISPFGIWREGYPSVCIGTLSAYDDIYCDAITWLEKGWIDYITPQIYWAIGSSTTSSHPNNTDYARIMQWWADSAAANGRFLIPGHAPYRMTDGSNWTANEVPTQIQLNRSYGNVWGSVFFRANDGVLDNPKGFEDSLKHDYYQWPALIPSMPWKDQVPPLVPQNIRYERVAGTGPAMLRWDPPAPAADGDTASRYVVYRFDHGNVSPSDIADPKNILSVEGASSSSPPNQSNSSPSYFVVTALDRNYNESSAPSSFLVLPPTPPVLAGPPNASSTVPLNPLLTWFAPPTGSSYQVQVATDSTFVTGLKMNDGGVSDTSRVVPGLQGQTLYYWRVSASNAGGTGSFSPLENFTTGFPTTVLLSEPASASPSVSVTPTFMWFASKSATSYRLQVSPSVTFSPLAVDSTVASDTLLTLTHSLQGTTIYNWRVEAVNAVGPGEWSDVWRFRTETPSSVVQTETTPSEFRLRQSYPNPFNPATTIEFSIPEEARVFLAVYDLLGRQIRVLVNGTMNAGTYRIVFDGSELPSGVYFYRIIAGGHVETKRMQLIR